MSVTAIPPSRPARIPALDAARGVAIVAMVIYHFGWNLSFLELIPVDLRDYPAWIWFGHVIAASFLALVGVGLLLGHGEGLKRERFLRRLALVAGAAALVTAGTYLVFPDQFIFFGILHHIALASVLALPFLRLPWVIAAGAAVAVFALPLVFKADAFSAPWLVWLGLGTRVPSTNDFVPVFPWFGCVLAGIALAKLWPPASPAAEMHPSAPVRALGWMGRKSLPIYLIHQPVLYGGLALLASAILPPVDRETRGFLVSCQEQCRSTGGDALTCSNFCGCVASGLKKEGLWQRVLVDTPDMTVKLRVDAVTRQCTAPKAP
ncbi:MAG: DUF1624 domain-containing protein [Beijerinckiaceae bacterium]|jgi:uncharacterized membrane protein|nr:DUF1624 domain-containing protein [Beijerinckiaceae bacterium]